jgi:hypothetical protein
MVIGLGKFNYKLSSEEGEWESKRFSSVLSSVLELEASTSSSVLSLAALTRLGIFARPPG